MDLVLWLCARAHARLCVGGWGRGVQEFKVNQHRSIGQPLSQGVRQLIVTHCPPPPPHTILVILLVGHAQWHWSAQHAQQ